MCSCYDYLSLSYIPLYKHVGPGYRENWLTCMRPHNENWHAHYSACMRYMATNAAMSQGKFTRDFGIRVFLASVVGSPHLLTVFARTVRFMCTFHVYKPTV